MALEFKIESKSLAAMAPIAPASWDRNTSAGEFAPSSRIWAASSAESPYRAEILIPVFFSNSSKKGLMNFSFLPE